MCFSSQIILEQLLFFLEEKHLENFIVGSQRLVEEISLLPDVQTAEPPKLFHSLAQDPATHPQAMEAYLDLCHGLVKSAGLWALLVGLVHRTVLVGLPAGGREAACHVVAKTETKRDVYIAIVCVDIDR